MNEVSQQSVRRSISNKKKESRKKKRVNDRYRLQNKRRRVASNSERVAANLHKKERVKDANKTKKKLLKKHTGV